MHLLNVESRFEIIEIPIFGAEFVLCLGSEKKSRKFLKKELGYEGELAPKRAWGCVRKLRNWETGYPIWVLYLGKNPCPRTIGHEITHLTAQVLQSRGIPLTEETEEIYAYLTGWIWSVLEK